MRNQNHSILVTGDFVLDHHIYEGRRRHYGDGISPGVRVKQEVGGAALIHRLLRDLVQGEGGGGPTGWTSCLAVREPADFDAIHASQRSYAFWRPLPRDAPPAKRSWRVSEAMGFGEAAREVPCAPWAPAPDLPEDPRVVVLSDGGMGFRQSPGCWTHLNLAAASWIVLKTAAPFASGDLWRDLASKHRDRLIVVLSAADLRQSEANVASGLSWEQSVESLLKELREGGALQALTQCRHLVVSFEAEGALWLDTTTGTVRLAYDAPAIEGDHDDTAKGTAFGLLTCLAAAIAWQITLDVGRPDLAEALERGLSAMRNLREQGHGPASRPADGFPAVRLADAIRYPALRFSRASFPAAAADDPAWSLLRESQRAPHPVRDLARLVVLRGPIALSNIPHLRIGKLLTVDRGEAESLRTLTQLIRRYKQRDPGKKPLSIGVFGPPGSGKSFAVQQIGKDLVGKEGWMEFNLAQFADTADLVGAFHQIRDRVLEGLVPIAFFDEFDCREYHWLQYLLAPMQDGRFQQGEVTHPLGKCIFIFAGGTSWTFDTFGPAEAEGAGGTKFRLAKGIDFKTRLDAYLDVTGPNRRLLAVAAGALTPAGAHVVSGHRLAEDQDDICFPIRRALMIRAELQCPPEGKIDIDEGLLHALLNVPRFTHGSRSLGKILEPFRAGFPGPLHTSLLLPRAQLAMHTDADAFLRLCASSRGSRKAPEPMDERETEALAPAIHDTYRALGRKEGWLRKEKDIDFSALSPFLRESNRAAARRMPGILAHAGLRLEPLRATDEEEAAVREHLEYHLDLLAEAEHEGWMQWHLAQGWHYAPKRDDEKRLHPALVPFSQLGEADKNKDRDSVRHYPDFARTAGRKVAFVPTSPEVH